MLKTLLIGKDGQVGWELQRALSPLGELVSLGRQQIDLTDIDAVRDCVRAHRPKVIVNAAAYTAVDKAETEPEQARLVNDHAVKTLAEEALRLESLFVHYSTDYVFDGNKTTAYQEDDETSPLSVYGRTKRDGENAIRKSGCKHLIFRTSWVYSVYGTNFPLAILRRALERDRIDVVSDSVGAPTSASLIADVTAHVLYRSVWDPALTKSAGGTYHLTASGETSWYEYAKFLVGQAEKKKIPLKVTSNMVFPVSADTYKTVAKRPKNSLLDNRKLCAQFGLVLPGWETHVERFVDELVWAKLL
ncbi:MAG: dTDP-4-dehydrorhamnose reductase [Alphaproteobacteria bacterium]|nr:dTDP-4-dehydrorhamnose reductase [Alphaproteobacteria bacterium]